MAFIYDLIDTWNDAGTTFTAIKMNVTDTASDAASLLMDLQVGGVSKFKVDKNGTLINDTPVISDGTTILGSAVNGTFKFKMTARNGGHFSLGPSRYMDLLRDGALSSRWGLAGTAAKLILNSTGNIEWNPLETISGNNDLILARDAANTLALRNSTNAQTFNIYNTYTDASNYERGFMRWNSNVFEIGTEHGNGSNRSTRIASSDDLFLYADGSDRVQINNAEIEFREDIHPQGAAGFSNGIRGQGWSALWLGEVSTDPLDPVEGEAVMWLSDGTGSGDDGDFMMKITAGGVTKTVTLVDFSTA